MNLASVIKNLLGFKKSQLEVIKILLNCGEVDFKTIQDQSDLSYNSIRIALKELVDLGFVIKHYSNYSLVIDKLGTQYQESLSSKTIEQSQPEPIIQDKPESQSQTMPTAQNVIAYFVKQWQTKWPNEPIKINAIEAKQAKLLLDYCKIAANQEPIKTRFFYESMIHQAIYKPQGIYPLWKDGQIGDKPWLSVINNNKVRSALFDKVQKCQESRLNPNELIAKQAQMGAERYATRSITG